MQESKKVQNLAKEDDIVLPDAGMVSDEDSDNDMAFLDNIAESKQIERLNKARKRQIENLGEDFEQGKRRYVYSKVVSPVIHCIQVLVMKMVQQSEVYYRLLI